MGIGICFIFIRAPRDNAEINSIAVLPLANASGDKESEYLSDGIAETLINNFTRIPELQVTARGTAFRFRGREGEPQEIGRELGVGAVLAGKLLQRQNALSIQVVLINTSNGVQIWGDRYEGNSTEIVKIQQQIAADVSSQLKLRLTGAQQQQVAKTYTQNSEAYQHYLRGRYCLNRRTADDLKEGFREFRSASEIDPNYALAYVGLADTYLLLSDYAQMPSSEALPQDLASRWFLERSNPVLQTATDAARSKPGHLLLDRDRPGSDETVSGSDQRGVTLSERTGETLPDWTLAGRFQVQSSAFSPGNEKWAS